MNITPFLFLACPLDGAPLYCQGSAWRCGSGHSFDVASQGYINLLPVQKKRSLDPGDSKEMVAARRRFLNAGFYQPIAAAVSRMALAGQPSGAILCCLDAGCGEGYYLRQLAAAPVDDITLAVLGLDISKWAVLSVAKQDKRPSWVVGSNANLPVLSGTLDRVLCMFGFPVYGEFARVLKPGGELLQVDAGPDHLRELREIIYPTLKPERGGDARTPPGFSRLGGETVSYQVEIVGAEQIADLLAMTPHLYRASAEGRAKAAALTRLAVTVDVCLTRFGVDPLR
jgi:23S rRNA (guanine745-N1)-methyltransferase